MTGHVGVEDERDSLPLPPVEPWTGALDLQDVRSRSRGELNFQEVDAALNDILEDREQDRPIAMVALSSRN